MITIFLTPFAESPPTEDTECTVLAEGHHAYSEYVQNDVKVKLSLHGMIVFSLIHGKIWNFTSRKNT